MAQASKHKISFYNVSPKEQQILNEAVLQGLAALNLTKPLEIEIIFQDKENITLLNSLHRNKNNHTDVLSFPQTQFDLEHNILGSIVICPEIVAEKEENLTEVVKHGLLHLLNYDHETNETKWNSVAKKIDCKL